MKKLRRLFAHSLQVSVLAFLVLAGYAGYNALQEKVAENMSVLKADLIARAESLLGYEIGYEGISPSFLSTVEIRDLTVREPESRVQVLNARKIRLHYNPLSLLFAGDETPVVTRVSIIGLRVDFRHERDLPILAGLSGGGKTAAGDRAPFDAGRWFSGTLRIRSWSLMYRSGKMTARGTGSSLSLRQMGDYLRLSLKGSFGMNNPDSALSDIQLKAGVKGTVSNSLTDFNLDGDFRGVRTNLADIADQKMNVRYNASSLRVTKIQDNKPYDLTLQRENGLLSVNFKAEQFSPDEIVVLKGGYAPLNPWLSTRLSGEGRFDLEEGTGLFTYSYDGSAFISNELMPFAANVFIDVTGDDLHLEARELRVATPYGTARYAGIWYYHSGYPEGELNFDGIPAGDGRSLGAGFSLASVEDYFYINSRYIRMSDGLEPGNLKILLYREAESYIFSVRSELDPENRLPDRILVDGEFSFRDGFSLQSSYSVSQMEFRSLYALLPEKMIPGALRGMEGVRVRSDGGFTYSGDSLAVRMNRLELFLPEGNRNLLCSGFFMDGEFEVYSLEVNWDRNYLLGSAGGSFSPGRVFVESRWNLNDNQYLINGLYRNGQISIAGNHQLKAQILRDSGSGFLASFESKELPLTWDGLSFSTDLNVRGRYRRDHWEAYLSDSVVRWLDAGVLNDPSVKLTAYLAPGVVNLFSLNYRDDLSDLKGSGNLFFNLDQQILNGSLELGESGVDAGRESYAVYCAYNGGNISATVSLKNALLDRYPTLEMKGRLDSDVTLEGSLDAPEISGSIAAEDLVINRNRLGVSGKFRVNPEKMEVFDLSLQRNNLQLTRGLGIFNLEEGSLVFTTGVNNVPEDREDQSRIDTGISLMVQTGRSFSMEDLRSLGEQDFSGRIRFHPIRWNDITTYPSRTVEFSRRGKVLEGFLAGDPSQSFRYDGAAGDIRVSVSRDFPLAMDMTGNLNPDKLDLVLENVYFDLNLVNYFMPKDRALANRYVVFRDGSRLEGRLAIRGTAANPDIYGELETRDLYVLTPYTVADIEKTDIVFTFRDDRVETNEFFIPIGEGGLRAKGYMNLSAWGIGDYNLDIRAVGDPGTPVVYSAYGLQGKGAFTGDFRLYGTSRQGGFEGRVVFNELIGSMGEKTVLEKRDKDTVRYPFRLNLEIETGKNVLFILPNPQLEIVRATAEQGERIVLEVDSGNQTLAMNGAINIRNGEIYYFDRTFQMTEGSLTFNENQDTFNPFLNVEAEIETNDLNGDDVTVYLTYRNPILDDFVPSFRSDPPLAEDRILALFGQSLVPFDEDEDVDLSTLLVATGGMVSQYGIVEPFEKALKDSLNLDTVTIKTEILENALLDQLTREDVYSGTGSNYNMGKYLDNTSFYLGKFLGDSLFISLGVLVDYDELDGLRSFWGGMSLVPDLSLEMRTPFFLVSWNYNDDNAYDFDNTDFVPKNSISLEWQYSY